MTKLPIASSIATIKGSVFSFRSPGKAPIFCPHSISGLAIIIFSIFFCINSPAATPQAINVFPAPAGPEHIVRVCFSIASI